MWSSSDIFHLRRLLNHEVPEEFDMLNQHTWDWMDWFLFSSTLFVCGFICFCIGCWSYKQLYIEGPDDVDEEVEEFTTPISPSKGKRNFDLIAGYTIFGEKLEVRNHAHHQQIPSATNSPYTSPRSTMPITPIQSVPTQVSKSRHTSPVSYVAFNTPTATKTRVVNKLSMIMIPHPDEQNQATFPNVAVPQCNVDDAVVTSPTSVITPDSAEESQSHLSIEISAIGTTVAPIDPLAVINENISAPFAEDHAVTP